MSKYSLNLLKKQLNGNHRITNRFCSIVILSYCPISFYISFLLVLFHSSSLSIDLQQDDSLFSVDLIDDDFFKWEIWFVGPPGTLYENGSFHAILTFPEDFPNNPPTMKIKEEMWHPNSESSSGSVWDEIGTSKISGSSSEWYTDLLLSYYCNSVYPDGTVCISILHPPGTDVLNEQESADERWRPILGVESIMLSVMSMLGSPNVDSPANVDAAVGWLFHEIVKIKTCESIFCV